MMLILFFTTHLEKKKFIYSVFLFLFFILIIIFLDDQKLSDQRNFGPGYGHRIFCTLRTHLITIFLDVLISSKIKVTKEYQSVVMSRINKLSFFDLHQCSTDFYIIKTNMNFVKPLTF